MKKMCTLWRTTKKKYIYIYTYMVYNPYQVRKIKKKKIVFTNYQPFSGLIQNRKLTINNDTGLIPIEKMRT